MENVLYIFYLLNYQVRDIKQTKQLYKFDIKFPIPLVTDLIPVLITVAIKVKLS